MVYNIFDKITGSGISVNEQLAEKLHKLVLKKFKRKKTMRDLKTIFGQQIQLEWNRCLPRIKISNICYVSLMFSLNIHGLNL